MDVGVADLSVVTAVELDLPLRRGQLLAAGTLVLQGSHFGGVAERREKCWCEESGGTGVMKSFSISI